MGKYVPGQPHFHWCDTRDYKIFVKIGTLLTGTMFRPNFINQKNCLNKLEKPMYDVT